MRTLCCALLAVWLCAGAVDALVPVTLAPSVVGRGSVVTLRGTLGPSRVSRGCRIGGMWVAALLDEPDEVRCLVPEQLPDGLTHVCLCNGASAPCFSDLVTLIVGEPPRLQWVSSQRALVVSRDWIWRDTSRVDNVPGQWIEFGGSSLTLRMVCVVCNGMAAPAVAVTSSLGLCRLPDTCVPGRTELSVGLDAAQQSRPLTLTIGERVSGRATTASASGATQPPLVQRNVPAAASPTDAVVPAPSLLLTMARVTLVCVVVYWVVRLLFELVVAVMARPVRGPEKRW